MKGDFFMIEDRQPMKTHKVDLLNRSLGVITGVRDVVSFDLNEIILDTEQGLLMIKGFNLHVKKLLVEKARWRLTAKLTVSCIQMWMTITEAKKKGCSEGC